MNRRGPKPGWLSEDARAASLHRRKHRAHVLDGRLLANCWCERHEVLVTAGEVRAGQTRSCGFRNCDPSVMEQSA